MKASDLIYDWNQDTPSSRAQSIHICDETLRDGLQGSVPRQPSIEEKLELLVQLDRLGVNEAAVGFPAQGVAYREALDLCKQASQENLRLRLSLLGRAIAEDIEAIADIQQASGRPILARLVVGCSPIRRYVETNDLDRLEHAIASGISYATQLGVPTLLGMEDTSRAEPQVIERFFTAAVEAGVEVLSICDTVGHITPFGIERLIRYCRKFLDDRGYGVHLSFHGHNDRGLGVANALAAIRAGADAIDGTVLGIGERAGNIPLELLLVNLKLQNLWPHDISTLKEYVRRMAEVCGLTISPNYPIFGRNAFVTQAGLHASGILKAEMRGEADIAAAVYSSMDPHIVGLDYQIQVGPHSGRSNVKFILHRQGLTAPESVVDRILQKARDEKRILSPEEVCSLATPILQS